MSSFSPFDSLALVGTLRRTNVQKKPPPPPARCMSQPLSSFLSSSSDDHDRSAESPEGDCLAAEKGRGRVYVRRKGDWRQSGGRRRRRKLRRKEGDARMHGS